ncbi:MAG: universal stress protein [Chlorobium sp.]|jgi:nucleotide-binding universal stress UspA family protein|uniref:universal stress protein n=1 Tax=Chlorobium sp. TaxID=1095 RepID=UPI001D4018AB|nr:universal stress protein [Chlorobium sp.]MBN1278265.1 universal stress protein [Chlorobiaceae bacterium]MCF8216533.1 universal stress protein [Chlorobium sp.]MCF8271438.1 universal stress protein [Chlorobium sp.]MCF8287810.1 universal stress protein [Chlorobium sp.]MCF8291349.1 universal stress protein [Chlorobium sp.]
MIHLSRILCPTDYSVSSDRAVRYAIEFSRLTNAHVRFLHVHPPDNIAVKTAAGYGLNIGSEEAFDVIPQSFSSLLMSEKKNGLSADMHVLQGEAAKVITAHAHTWGTDLIIMGSHGRSGLARLLMGSVAEAVFRTADVPVLLVKQSGPEKAVRG